MMISGDDNANVRNVGAAKVQAHQKQVAEESRGVSRGGAASPLPLTNAQNFRGVRMIYV